MFDTLDKLATFLKENSFVENLAITILISLVVWGLSQGVKIVSKYVLDLQAGSISIEGIWLAKFPSGVDGKKNIEVVEISTRGSSLAVNIYQYSIHDGVENSATYAGTGYLKGNSVVIAFSSTNKKSPQNGALFLRLLSSKGTGSKLSGFFSEFVDPASLEEFTEKGEQLTKGEYELHELKLGAPEKLRLFIKKPPFKNYSQADQSAKAAGITTGDPD